MKRLWQALFGKPTPLPIPKVGMRLYDSKWGKDWNTIEIVRVSADKNEVMYKFIFSKGSRPGGYNLFTVKWIYLIDSYTIDEGDKDA